jgi:excinuclease ABC subunit C
VGYATEKKAFSAFSGILGKVKEDPPPPPPGAAQPSERDLRIEALLEACPVTPGVYLMKDAAGKVIYVGKAKNLRSRVRSYFQSLSDASPKTQHLVSHVHDLEFLRVSTEVEALLLENNLIKKWRPKYNISLKDDKTYPYLRIDRKHPFPRPYIARKQFQNDGSEYFGPFPAAGALRETLRAAAKVFQLRDCRDHEFSNRSRPCLSYEIGQCTAPCTALVSKEAYGKQVEDFASFLRGEDGRLRQGWAREMEEAAEKLDFERAAFFRDRIAAVEELLGESQRAAVTNDPIDRDVWALWPENFAQLQDDEELLDVLVLQFRSGLLSGRVHWSADTSQGVPAGDELQRLVLQHYQKHPLPKQVLLPPGCPADMRQALGLALQAELKLEEPLPVEAADEKAAWAGLWELARDNVRGWHEDRKAVAEKKGDGLLAIAELVGLPAAPRRIECIDISNFQGEANVASCVVFIEGQPAKDLYRHYNIKGVSGQDDFKSLQELVSRRYLKPDSVLPDLLVVDGGRGQLASVCRVLDAADLDFPVCSLAKARTKADFTSAEVESSEERVFLPNVTNPKRIKNAEAFRILTQARDEAHRFAITFHRKQRSKARGI